jgi:hypothetical protein
MTAAWARRVTWLSLRMSDVPEKFSLTRRKRHALFGAAWTSGMLYAVCWDKIRTSMASLGDVAEIFCRCSTLLDYQGVVLDGQYLHSIFDSVSQSFCATFCDQICN